MSKWILSHGIHRHTITSRDSGAPEEFDSRQEALNALEEHRAWYRRIGYVIWFADLTDPSGNTKRLEQDASWH